MINAADANTHDDFLRSIGSEARMMIRVKDDTTNLRALGPGVLGVPSIVEEVCGAGVCL